MSRILGRLMFSEIPPTVSAGERNLLRKMVDNEEDSELAQSFPHGGWWVGCDQVSGKTCYRLIHHALISISYGDDDKGSGVIYWEINETGKRVLSDPNYVPWTIRMAKGEKGPFTE